MLVDNFIIFFSDVIMILSYVVWSFLEYVFMVMKVLGGDGGKLDLNEMFVFFC